MRRSVCNAASRRARPAARVVGAGCVLAWAAVANGMELPPADAPLAPATAQRLAEAATVRAAGRWQEAAERYREALTLDPASQAAREGLRAVEELLAGQTDPARALPNHDDVRHQLALVEARAALERAELLARSGQPDQAAEALIRARALLLSDRDRASVDADLGRIEILLREMLTNQAHAAGADGATTRIQARVAAERAAVAAIARQTSQLHERLTRIRALLTRQHNALALEAARGLVIDVPGNPEAEAIFNEALAAAHVQRRSDLAERSAELQREVHARIHDSLIPSGFDGKPIYPPNWTEQHQGRVEIGVESAAFEPWREELLDRLAGRVSVDFDSLGVDEALAFLAKAGVFNLVVDPVVFANGGATVTLRATDMRIDTVLTWIGRLTGSTWVISKGAVYFGGQQREDTVLAVYDLAHLISAPYDQGGYEIAFTSSAGGTRGGSSFNIFTENEVEVAKVAPEDLVDLIRNAVSPGSWDGTEQTMEIRGSGLYVTASRSTHLLLNEFLRSQAYARSLVVHVACRWLTISDSYLERIGIDWGSAQNLLSLNGSVPLGYAHNTENARWGGNVQNVLPASTVASAANLVGTGLNLSVLRIGEQQWSAVIQAVEQKNQGRVLANPEVTTLNGVRGNTFFGQQFAYISDYEIVERNLDPVISVLNIGASLDVKPYVSADRKYVTMEFRPGLATVTFFTELISAPRITTAGGFLGIVSGPLPYPIELPNVAIDEVSTTIIVPDRGMLMVGGFNRTIEQQTSAKVPFLGHVPYLGRLFGTRGRFSERTRIYLLAAVDIIDYREAEENL